MVEPYLLRFSKKLLVEMEEFLTGQQMVTACLLAIAAFLYQFISGKLTWVLFKENAASVVYPFVWVVCGFGCYYVLKAAIHLHREMKAEVNSYRPAIPGFVPRPPSPIPAAITAALCISILGCFSYVTFKMAFPRIRAPDVSQSSAPQVSPPTPSPSPNAPTPVAGPQKRLPTGSSSPCFSPVKFSQKSVQAASGQYPYAKLVTIFPNGAESMRLFSSGDLDGPPIQTIPPRLGINISISGPPFTAADIQVGGHSQPSSFVLKIQTPREIEIVCVDRIMKESTRPSENLSMGLAPYVLKKSEVISKSPPVNEFDYGLSAILRVRNDGPTAQFVRQLEIAGDSDIDCGEYHTGMAIEKSAKDPKAETAPAEFVQECKQKKPFRRLSWVAYPIGQSRIDPNGDEQFIRFRLLPLESLAFYSGASFSSYIGFRTGNIAPSLLTTLPHILHFAEFTKSGPGGGDIQGFVLRPEVREGTIQVRVLVGTVRKLLKPADLQPMRETLEEYWNQQSPQDLFYGQADPIYDRLRPVSVGKDPAMQRSK